MARPMTEREWRQFVTDSPARTAKLALTRRDGRPHVAPIWIDLDRNGDILFNTGRDTVKGRILQRGGLRKVTNHPEDPFVAAFVGMETLLKGQVTECREGLLTLRIRKGTGNGEVVALGEAEPGQTALVGVRPEHVSLSLHSDNTSSARNAFPGAVTKVIPRGPFFKVELDCGFFLAAFVTAQSLSELGLRPGCPVVASFKATSVHLIRKEGLAPEL